MSVGLRVSIGVTLGFVPLILYWSISNTWGMISGCMVAIYMLVKNIWAHKMTPMNLFLSFYFVVINMLYFGGKQKWVFSSRHVLSYFALGIFAWVSVYLDKPYTLYEARKSYSKSFDGSPLFLEVNLLITKIWGSVYIMAALIRLLTNNALGIITIHLLIVVGIVLSITIPNYMPET